MSEFVCPHCGIQPPENALYCQGCGHAVRCQKCHAVLLALARACTQCGNLITEAQPSNQFHSGTAMVPPGYNRLRLHETPNVRDVDLLLSDNAIEQIKDFLPPFINARSGINKHSDSQQESKQPDIVEAPPEVPPSQPQLPAASPQLGPDRRQEIWQIFREHEGKIRQEISDLKAKGKKNYTIRLLHLYLYARLQLGEEKVPRSEVYEFLDDAGVRDNNLSNYISRENGITSEGCDLRLNQAGRNKAQQYIEDALKTDSAEGWYPGSATKSANRRTKRTSTKRSDKQKKSNSKIVDWTSHESTKLLADSIHHRSISTMNILNKSLFGLYGISKIEAIKGILPNTIAKYLYDVFQIHLSRDSIRKALIGATKKSPPYVSHLEGSGYRITNTGIEYIEDLIKQFQFQKNSSILRASANGAVQHENNA